MNGRLAIKLWECAVEPVRIEGARARAKEPNALGRYEAAAVVLGKVRWALIQAVTQDEGQIATILAEYSAITKEIRTLGGAA